MELLIKDARSVWIPNHPTAGYLPGRVDETGDDGVLIVVDEESGEQFRIPQADAQSVDPACLLGVDDLLTLGDFNEAALLHNIRVRYRANKIYTGIGTPILISVNPYQNIPGLYSKARQAEYRGNPSTPGSPGAPSVHLYSVVDAAYRAMLGDRSNQSIVISGESGSGKTEATKHMLAYLADMQRSAHTRSGAGAGQTRTVEQQVLDANPVLEAFGNAKTMRNDNSSRFGKFIEVEFDGSGKLISARISNYLLEKCRIVTQQPEERNYHIFYQLCAGMCTAGIPGGLALEGAGDFDFASVNDKIDGVDDAAQFAEVFDCMLSLGFTIPERDSALKVVASVLHLGALRFSPCSHEGVDGVALDNAATAALVCGLLGIQEESLRNVFDHKTLEDPLTKKTIHVPHNPQSASYTRHSMAKVVYARLFDWLVRRINDNMSEHRDSGQVLHRIGLLDIYGFEIFEWNSFEQLCINFANEKLQQHFNSHMFTQEQRLYTNEGISWTHIHWQDNQHIIDALEQRPLGLFRLIDSECLMPNGSDESLHGKILNSFKNSKIVFKPGRFASLDFAIAHYAGEVVYSVDTFLDKNIDKLHVDIVNLFKTSTDPVVNTLFNDPRLAGNFPQPKAGAAAKPGDRAKRRSAAPEKDDRRERQNVTVGMMFREQLDKLVEDLNKTNPRYVRCIKPNANKRPDEFDSVDVLRQLRCAGMLESIRIRRAGYAVRRPFKEFFTRFRILSPRLVAAGPDPDFRDLCRRLAQDVEQRLRQAGAVLDDKPWQIGQSRLFMKEELERHFERLIVEGAKHHVSTLQRRWRGYRQRKEFRSLRDAAGVVQAAIRTQLAVARMLEVKRRLEAATVLQAALRASRSRLRFLASRAAALRVQTCFRGWRCRSKIGNLRSKVAADKIRRLRAESERAAELEKARQEAEARAREVEEMRRQLEETQRRFAEEKARPPAAPAAPAFEPGPRAEGLRDGGASPSGRVPERLTSAEAGLEGKSRDAGDRPAATQRWKDDDRDFVPRVGADSPKGAAPSFGDTTLSSLRAEILARCGVDAARAPPAAGHAFASALSRIDGDGTRFGDDALQPPSTASLSPGKGRNTLANQRELFETLKQQFHEARAGHKSDDAELAACEIAQDDGSAVQNLEDEMRRLRRENATMKTRLMSAQEEAIERTAEVEVLLGRVSSLQAELEDAQLSRRGENSDFRRQMQENVGTLRQQNEDMARMVERTRAAEERAAAMSARAEVQGSDIELLRARVASLEAGRADLEQELVASKMSIIDSQNRGDFAIAELETLREQAAQDHDDWRAERERLLSDLRARENEAANLKRLLDEVMGAHAPVEEVHKWKALAESYEYQYQQAMKYNREVTSAVGHMTQAAGERGADLNDLQRRNAILVQEQEKKVQELKMAELEKQDLQKERDTLESSCNYFQTKYKATQNDLRALQREQAIAQEAAGKMKAQLGDCHRELEAHRARISKLTQQRADMDGALRRNAQRTKLLNDALGVAFALHSEQARLYERACGEVQDEDLKRGLQEVKAKERASRAQVRTLLAEAVSEGGGLSASQPHAPVADPNQRAHPQGQQH